ncbi:HamA C-terminal domain-containing protein [Nocardioides nematodiphilus]|uniref:HamA C-terminal domain-containing protein n=1 Tax=Nocardioides nematodiphilus TaxID=2849669 RepID=UPI001CD981CA|nr:DUF1837 domain-containing protein [Nocardioides nematodiphilus]MCA1982197.1 DUF1837 domain-containing protein [Nocardioides nematodiphilus]
MARPPFLDVIVQDLGASPSVTGLCAGYENSVWRADALAARLIEEIPSFALTHRERADFADDTGVHLMGVAVRKIYTTDKYKRRGEFGELLLHLVLREVFGTQPAISKMFFKDAANDTVKGFDAVHVVAPDGGALELWLGEVKFYIGRSDAIRDVVAELHDHSDRDYLRSEFAAIVAKLDSTWEHHEQLAALLDRRTSLDQIFDAVTVPVLLTYESSVVDSRVGALAGGASPSETDEYRRVFQEEILAGLAAFSAKGLPERIRIRLILVPLHTKEALLSALHARLVAWQQATN